MVAGCLALACRGRQSFCPVAFAARLFHLFGLLCPPGFPLLEWSLDLNIRNGSILGQRIAIFVLYV